MGCRSSKCCKKNRTLDIFRIACARRNFTLGNFSANLLRMLYYYANVNFRVSTFIGNWKLRTKCKKHTKYSEYLLWQFFFIFLNSHARLSKSLTVVNFRIFLETVGSHFHLNQALLALKRIFSFFFFFFVRRGNEAFLVRAAIRAITWLWPG